jgi:hypothetical protein
MFFFERGCSTHVHFIKYCSCWHLQFKLLNSGTKSASVPKASIPHVLPLGFAAGTRALRFHVLSFTLVPLSYPEASKMYILLRLTKIRRKYAPVSPTG